MGELRFKGKTGRKVRKRDRRDVANNILEVDSLCDAVIFFLFGVGMIDPTPTNEILGMTAVFGCRAFLDWVNGELSGYSEESNPYQDMPDYEPAPVDQPPVFDTYVSVDADLDVAAGPFDMFTAQATGPLHIVVPEEEAARRQHAGALVLLYGPDVEDPHMRRMPHRRITILEPSSFLFPENFQEETPAALRRLKDQIASIAPTKIEAAGKVVGYQAPLYKRRTFVFKSHGDGKRAIDALYDAFSGIKSTDLIYTYETSDRYKEGDYVLISAQFFREKTKGPDVNREWAISF